MARASTAVAEHGPFTAVVEHSLFTETRPLEKPSRKTIAKMIGDVLKQGAQCSDLSRDPSAFVDQCFVMSRGNVQLAVRFLSGLIHFYSVLILADDFDPFDPDFDPDHDTSIFLSTSELCDLYLFPVSHIERVSFADIREACSEREYHFHRHGILHALERIARVVAQFGKSLLIVQEGVEDGALTALLIDQSCSGLTVGSFRASSPGYGECATLGDIATLTSSKPVKFKNLDELELQLRRIVSQARTAVTHLDPERPAKLSGPGDAAEVQMKEGNIDGSWDAAGKPVQASHGADFDARIAPAAQWSLAHELAHLPLGEKPQTYGFHLPNDYPAIDRVFLPVMMVGTAPPDSCAKAGPAVANRAMATERSTGPEPPIPGDEIERVGF